jgi:hypothetical protein
MKTWIFLLSMNAPADIAKVEGGASVWGGHFRLERTLKDR